jgi:hypothetical protein
MQQLFYSQPHAARQPASFDVAIKSPGHHAAEAAGYGGWEINGHVKQPWIQFNLCNMWAGLNANRDLKADENYPY